MPFNVYKWIQKNKHTDAMGSQALAVISATERERKKERQKNTQLKFSINMLISHLVKCAPISECDRRGTSNVVKRQNNLSYRRRKNKKQTKQALPQLARTFFSHRKFLHCSSFFGVYLLRLWHIKWLCVFFCFRMNFCWTKNVRCECVCCVYKHIYLELARVFDHTIVIIVANAKIERLKSRHWYWECVCLKCMGEVVFLMQESRLGNECQVECLSSYIYRCCISQRYQLPIWMQN